MAAADRPSASLRRSLGPVHVTLLSLWGIIGAGIFATVGDPAAGVGGAPRAGPSLVLAFVMVCAAVLIMRRTNPNATRPFRCPFSTVIPMLGIATCLLLMFSLPAENWWRLGIWLVAGFVIYFAYGRYHSVMAVMPGVPVAATPASILLEPAIAPAPDVLEPD